MYVDVVLSPAESVLYDFSGKTAVVIDVSLCHHDQVALEAGITAFFPVQEVEEAFGCRKGRWFLWPVSVML